VFCFSLFFPSFFPSLFSFFFCSPQTAIIGCCRTGACFAWRAQVRCCLGRVASPAYFPARHAGEPCPVVGRVSMDAITVRVCPMAALRVTVTDMWPCETGARGLHHRDRVSRPDGRHEQQDLHAWPGADARHHFIRGGIAEHERIG
jgi:hypothetical protein